MKRRFFPLRLRSPLRRMERYLQHLIEQRLKLGLDHRLSSRLESAEMPSSRRRPTNGSHADQQTPPSHVDQAVHAMLRHAMQRQASSASPRRRQGLIAAGFLLAVASLLSVAYLLRENAHSVTACYLVNQEDGTPVRVFTPIPLGVGESRQFRNDDHILTVHGPGRLQLMSEDDCITALRLYRGTLIITSEQVAEGASSTQDAPTVPIVTSRAEYRITGTSGRLSVQGISETLELLSGQFSITMINEVDKVPITVRAGDRLTITPNANQTKRLSRLTMQEVEDLRSVVQAGAKTSSGQSSNLGEPILVKLKNGRTMRGRLLSIVEGQAVQIITAEGKTETIPWSLVEGLQ